jgi:predicted  nucleic acid-binding Zn-ribbon protein
LPAIAHIERDLKDIDAAFAKMKSDITNNISDIDKQKRKFLSDIADMRKSLNHQRNVMNRAVEFVLIAMFVASVLYR